MTSLPPQLPADPIAACARLRRLRGRVLLHSGRNDDQLGGGSFVAAAPIATLIARGRALLGEVLRHGIARGEFRAVDVESAIDAIIAPLLMLVVWRFSLAHCGREIDPEAMLRTHFELLMHGLAVPTRKP